ncbi:MAG: hypothetical protein KAH72_05170 [Flavobacteriaceae bacterium]|nr:hypothetical protein [Flavobacteriaceae bacterium]
MKYTQLTKEQFEELHEEFAKFLATQKIDISEWEKIKNNKPEIADEELNLFSDLVWERVLNNTEYLEHFSKDSLNLFKCDDTSIQRIVVKVNKQNIDFLDKKDFNWFLDNSKDSSIEYFKGQKSFSKNRNMDIFDLIQQGSVVSKGELYEAVLKMIS